MRGCLPISVFAWFVLILLAGPSCGQPLSGPVQPTDETPRQTGWQATPVVRGLEHPWAAAFLPNGDMLITERPGALRVVRNGRLDPQPVRNVPSVAAIGQGGLLDIALHPDFENNRTLYLTYAVGDGQANATTLARAKILPDLSELTQVETLLQNPMRKPGGQHFGSRLLFLPDGTLLMSIGDGGNPPVAIDGTLTRHFVQDKSKLFGKILRVDENGKAPQDNPFVKTPDADPRVYALGVRNVQGIAMQPQTQAVYFTEHGARGGDELDRLQAGGNFGWPIATYSYEYSGPRISDQTAAKGMINPLIVWTPCIAPSGLAFYTGDKISDWQGDLFAGALRGMKVQRIVMEDGQPVGQYALHFDARIRDVIDGPDGYLYVLTDEPDGKLLRIEPAPDAD